MSRFHTRNSHLFHLSQLGRLGAVRHLKRWSVGTAVALLALGCLPEGDGNDGNLDRGIGGQGGGAGEGGQGGEGGFGGEGGAGGVGGEGGQGGVGGEGGHGGEGGEGGESGGMVPVTIRGEVIIANNYPSQLHPLYRASFQANSGMTRLALFARFCADADCAEPVAVVPAEMEDADELGRYALPSASPAGSGFFRPFTVRQAPVGRWHLQFVGDTQASVEFGQGACTDVEDCPGDADVVSVRPGSVGANVSGQRTNPDASAVPVEVVAADAELTLPEPIHLGHIVFDHAKLRTQPAPDPGRLLVALSNEDDTFRNAIALVDLDDPLANPGRAADSYTFQKNGAEFEGDVCGAVTGPDALYVIGVDAEGAHIFAVDPATGVQVTDAPIASIPPEDPENPESYPWPCRGVFAQRDTVKSLYLIQFKGAGALTTSRPYPLYRVDLDSGEVTTPFADVFASHALRGIAVDPLATALYVQDQSWSLDAINQGAGATRIYRFGLDANGDLGEPTHVVTDDTTDEACGSTNNWPGDLRFGLLGGAPRLLAGHDTGITVHDPETLAEVQRVDLTHFGRLISQIESEPGVTAGLGALYAVPQCKAYIPDSDFTLPYGVDIEPSDKNLVARLSVVEGALAVAAGDEDLPSIDINGDGTPDSGIDLDYWHLKNYIRQFESTLPIPPVVFTGARATVGRNFLAVRGSGIQGNGGNTQSSSGLGQVQDVGLFDLATGRGLIFNDYLPWYDGPSGVWGLDLVSGQESSVGLVHYLP